MTIIALTPSGSVLRFGPEAVDGYRNLRSLLRYYVTPSYVYLLTIGEKVDPLDSQIVMGRSRFIEVFSHNGDFVHTLTVGPDEEPINLAAFGSGDLLLFDLDSLNHTTKLHFLNATGRSESVSGLFDNDFTNKPRDPQALGSGASIYDDERKLMTLLSVASVTSRGNHLLLTPARTTLPTLELNEHGVVRAISFALPEDAVISELLPSNDALLHAVVGHLRSPSGKPTTFTGITDAPAIFSASEIDEF